MVDERIPHDATSSGAPASRRFLIGPTTARRLSACVVVLAALGADARATLVSYDRATFQAALAGGTVSGQNFDSLASGTILGTLNGVTYGASGGSAIVTNQYLTTTSPNGLGSTSVGFFLGTETATFTFATAITAFAIDVNTFAPTAGDYSATLNTGDVAFSKFDVFPGTATGQFIGFTSDTAFTSVTIRSLVDSGAGMAYSYTLDTLVYGSRAAIGVPEPSSLAMLGSGASSLAIAAVRRRPRAGRDTDRT